MKQRKVCVCVSAHSRSFDAGECLGCASSLGLAQLAAAGGAEEVHSAVMVIGSLPGRRALTLCWAGVVMRLGVVVHVHVCGGFACIVPLKRPTEASQDDSESDEDSALSSHVVLSAQQIHHITRHS